MNHFKTMGFKAGLVSVLLVAIFISAWYLAAAASAGVASGTSGMTAEQIEYQKMMGKDPASAGNAKTSGFPMQMGQTFVRQLSDRFYDRGPNDEGIAIQLAHSLGRVGLGFLLACLVPIPLGFVIGMSPLLRRAFDPFIQRLKPISPLAWMPLALYTIKDSSASGIFVIFICSVWPMLINTAFGVVNPLRKAFQVILPAAAPTILTGMRIPMGIAWLVGGTGIGYFVWNEWNNLSLTNVIFAIVVIGLVGMLLDLSFAQLQKAVTYVE